MDRRGFIAIATTALIGLSDNSLAQDATDPLDARVGGTLAGFEAKHGAPIPADEDHPLAKPEYVIPGFGSVLVDDLDGVVCDISLFPPRPDGEEWGMFEPHPMNWTITQAHEIAMGFLPLDFQVSIARDEIASVIMTEGYSSTLAARVPEAVYAYVDDVYDIGQCSYALLLDSEHAVSWVVVQLEVETHPDDY